MLDPDLRKQIDLGFESPGAPLMIDKLRHQTYHVTGLRVYDYRTNKDVQRAQFEEKLRVLRRSSLVSAESRCRAS